MMHTDSKGDPKILRQCTLTLTATGHVKRISTDMAVFDVSVECLDLREMAEGIAFAELRAATGALSKSRISICRGSKWIRLQDFVLLMHASITSWNF
ncbi:hypothetical protein [Rhizobium laguerreae]|uniref:hypothetical protein n=1 Tax=Rhizobium laguerreae TaxID=1076926 RepID=UPI0021B0D061|nr:hypothetical protein [Rhizobium laguerreae]